jgi:hypothetical protein
MTPSPSGYPRSSPSFNNIVGNQLTDAQIHDYALRGFYGEAAQKRAKFNDIVNQPVPRKVRDKANDITIQSTIDSLLNRHKHTPQQ